METFVEKEVPSLEKPEALRKRARAVMDTVAFENALDSVDDELSAPEDDVPEELVDIHLSDDGINDYFRKMSRIPLLKAADEVELARKIEVGILAGERYEKQYDELNSQQLRELQQLIHEGQLANEKMVNANLRLVVSIAKQYKTTGLQSLDLIQEGNIGLMQAVKLFDYKKGFKFSTYATSWIRQSIVRALDNTSREIRVPVHTSELMRKILKTEQRLHMELSRMPTEEELSSELDISVVKLQDMKAHMRIPISLNAKFSNHDDAAELGDLLQDDRIGQPTEALEQQSLARSVKALIEELSEREAQVIRMRSGIQTGEVMKFEEIANALGMSRQRAQQLDRAARKKLLQLAEARKSDLMVHINQ